MKRIFRIFLLGFFCVILCGCNNKLNCSSKKNNVFHNVEIVFKNDKPHNATYKITYPYELDDAYIDMKLLELQNEYEELNNVAGISYNIKEKDSSLIVKINVDYTIFNKEIDKIPVKLDTLENNQIYLQKNLYSCN